MHEDNNPMGIWILYALASALLWIALVFLKVLGVVRISWIGVVLGLFWLPLVLMCLICGVAALVILIARIKRRHRRKVTDRRIIRQAKAIGAWTPQAAGGRALELLAEEYGIKREEGETDNKLLADIFADIDTGEIPMELTGYTEDEVESLVTALSEALHNDLSEPDDIPETPEAEAVISQKGDLWILGRHRVVCGDATNERDRELLLDGAHPEILLTDPPYCSGGFQESGRATGSIGSKQSDGKGGFTTPTISSDNLSTRGYQVLMKNVLGATDIKVAYIFTDWRMWIYLFDLVESSGLGVRNMIVWNKKSPGMGNGWRAQHELIMFAHRTKPKWDNHKGYSNVLEATRSGNELHPTQKPVEILEKLLDNTQWAEGVLDTFGGSGTTLIAAESVGQQAFLMEMEPAFVDTIVRRYIRTTGKTTGIRLIRKGAEQPREVFEGIFE